MRLWEKDAKQPRKEEEPSQTAKSKSKNETIRLIIDPYLLLLLLHRDPRSSATRFVALVLRLDQRTGIEWISANLPNPSVQIYQIRKKHANLHQQEERT
jgi:hypothetical protein